MLDENAAKDMQKEIGVTLLRVKLPKPPCLGTGLVGTVGELRGTTHFASLPLTVVKCSLVLISDYSLDMTINNENFVRKYL
jgi:hypothetical protein